MRTRIASLIAAALMAGIPALHASGPEDIDEPPRGPESRAEILKRLDNERTEQHGHQARADLAEGPASEVSVSMDKHDADGRRGWR